MLVKALGFFMDTSEFPEGMDFGDVFEALANHGVEALDSQGIYHACASPITTTYRAQEETWWVGIILKVRDAKTFNRLVTTGGGLRMTSDQLQDGKIAESTYFVASPTTGKGLMASYHGSPGLKLLEWAFRKVFKTAQSSKRMAAVDAAVGNEAKKVAARLYRGKLVLGPLIREGSLRDLIRQFRRVNEVEIKIASVEINRPFLRRERLKSSTRTERFVFNPNFNFEDAEVDALVEEMSRTDQVVLIDGQVEGGANETVSNRDLANKQIFGSTEYDDLHGTFVFEHSHQQNNVASSPVVHWLKSHLNNARIHGTLTTAQ